MFEWRNNNISIAESGGRIITATPGAERGSPFVCALYVRVSILVPGATGDRGRPNLAKNKTIQFRARLAPASRKRLRGKQKMEVARLGVFVLVHLDAQDHRELEHARAEIKKMHKTEFQTEEHQFQEAKVT